MSFDSGTNILTLYVSGTNAVTWYINFSGATNWNNAAIWMNNSWSILWNSWNILWNRYLWTGQNITTIATLSCPSTQIPKSNGAWWICSTDQVGWVGGTDYYTTGINFNSGTNMLTLYVTWFGPITQTITMSWATARYTASAWVNNTWSTITNRYITTWIHMNALAKATLNCAAWDIVKYNGTIWECSGDLQWVAWWVNYYTTGLSFDNTTNKLSLYVSWANTVSGYINLSWASNWNSAYTWMTSGTGNILSNRYNNIGININTLATATLSCSVWQIAKYNGTNWICGADLTWGSSLWLQWTPTNNIYYNLWNVGIGINNPWSTLSIWGIAWGSLYVDGTANFAIWETNSSFLISDAVNWTNAMQVDNDTQKAVLFDSHNAWYKVGIGTDTPTTKLSVVDGWTINVAPGVKNSYVNVTAPDTLGTTPPKGIDIGYVNSGILEWWYLWSKSGLWLLFSTDQADTHISRLDMTINPSWNVGIGAMSAGAKLHVAGDGKFTTSVQVGVSGAPRCTSQADAGKIVYGIVCVWTTYTPEFIGCTQNWSAASVTQKVIMTWASWVWAACPGGIIVGDTAI